MPLQELSRQPPVTGLGDLGSVLMDASRNYAQTARQDQLLAQQRAQQLQDVGSQRAYQDRVRAEERTAHLQDTETDLKLRARMAMIASLRNEGLLAPGQENDEVAVASAYKEFQNRGLEKLYDEMLHTPGPNGQPLLTPDNVTNLEAVQAAKAAYGQLKAKLLQADLAAKENTRTGGQAAANRALKSEDDINNEIKSLSAELNRPVAPVAASEVMQRARQMWLENHPGEKAAPTDPAKLAVETQTAAKELQTSRFMAAKERHDQIQQQIYLLRQQLVSQTQETGALGRQGFFANPTATTTPSPMGLTNPSGFQPLSKPSTSEDFTNFVKRPAGAGGTAAAASGILENPTNNPVIAAGNAEQKLRAASSAQATLNAAIQERDAVVRQLQDISTPQKIPTLGTGFGGMSVGSSIKDPVGTAQTASILLQRKAAAEAKIREIQAMLQGSTVMPPAINTPTSSTPAFSFGSAPSMAPAGMPMSNANADWWRTSAPDAR